MRTANFDLVVNTTARGEFDRTFAAYARMKDVLDRVDIARRTDTFRLQRAAYDTIRHATGLPARLVTNGIREYASGAWGRDRLPLDEKLMSFKGIDHVSVATLSGRVVVGCILSGYRQDRASGNKPLVDAILAEAGYPNGNGSLKDLVASPTPASVGHPKTRDGAA